MVGLIASAKPMPDEEKLEREASSSSMFLFTTDSRIRVVELNSSSINLIDNQGREDPLLIGFGPVFVTPLRTKFLPAHVSTQIEVLSTYPRVGR